MRYQSLNLYILQKLWSYFPPTLLFFYFFYLASQRAEADFNSSYIFCEFFAQDIYCFYIMAPHFESQN